MSFFDFKVPGLGGEPDVVGPLKGSVVLAVYVASRCGYTKQYQPLQQLYAELKSQRFAVVGFPCNQFGAQEPGSAREIQEFCSLTFGVQFPLTAKIDVNGRARHPLYAWLTAAENGYPGDIEWNFEKFLVDRTGRLIRRYPAGTPPTDPTLLQEIADILS